MLLTGIAVILVRLGPFLAEHGPGFITTSGWLAAAACALWSARRSGLDPRAMYWGIVSSMTAGLWGAHLLSLAVHGWEDAGPMALFQIVQGGKSLFGGLLLGGFAGWIYFRLRGLPSLAYADAALPAVALGYAIGRLGCFVNGDDFGTVTNLPWAVVYGPGTEAYAAHVERGWLASGAGASLPVHPVQLYSALLGLGIMAWLVARRRRFQGEQLCAYLVAYGAGRFLLERWRGDFRAVAGPLSLPQVFSVLFMIYGLALWVKFARDREKYAPGPEPQNRADRSREVSEALVFHESTLPVQVEEKGS
jgi:phosphatidylglycerol---prolipoprotein diacylglyceryl transferase